MPDTRDAAAVRIFPPALPLMTVGLGVALESLVSIAIEPSPPAAIRYGVGGTVILSAMASLGLWAVLLVRRSGQSENPWKPTTEIIERGPFRVSRNPMYLQMLIVCLGFAFLLWNAWILLLTPACAVALRKLVIDHEERYLEAKFGDSYRAYKRRVRRWI